jgi:putative addiction module component (TIGR02574 family)
MTIAQKKVFTDAKALPAAAKVRLVKELLDDIQAETVRDVDAAWKAEIKRRVEAFERGEVTWYSGDEVLRELKKKYSK